MSRNAVKAKKQQRRATREIGNSYEALVNRQNELVAWLYQQDRMLGVRNVILQRHHGVLSATEVAALSDPDAVAREVAA